MCSALRLDVADQDGIGEDEEAALKNCPALSFLWTSICDRQLRWAAAGVLLVSGGCHRFHYQQNENPSLLMAC